MRWIKVKNNLYRNKSFWLTKKWLEEKPIFSFWKNLYRGSYELNVLKNYKDILLPTLSSFAGAVIYSAFIIFILELFNRYYPVSIQFDKPAIDTFLTVIASVSGVFLGLYFTAISSIASNYLLRAPQNVKRFFLSEPRGQQYVRTIAITAIVSVFYIVTKSFGHTIHPAGIAFLSLLVAYIVIRFWQVGTNVFYSLEPQFALPWITRDLHYSMANVVPPGFQWDKPAIQNHHRRLGVEKFDLIKNLVRFGKAEMKISDEQLVTTIRYIGGLLFAYADHKSKIPTGSYWYETKNEFQDWTLANSSQIAIALNTGTPLQPKNVKDYTWYEEQALNISIEVCGLFSETKKIISNAKSLDVFVEVAEVYAKDFDVKSAELLFKKADPISELVYTIKADNIQQHTHKEQLAFVDAQGRLATSALIGFLKYLDKKMYEEIAGRVAKIDWQDKKSIYLAGLPAAMLPRLETLFNELRNEKSIEGRLVSADWYIKAFCIQQYLFSLQQYFNFLKSLHQNYFQSNLDKLLSQQQLPLAVHLIQRWKEFSVKYRRMVFDLKKHIENCDNFRKLKDLPWSEFDFNQEQQIALEKEKEVTDRMIQLLPKLKTLIAGNDLPDYFGQALTEGIQSCYDAFEDNDHERLKKIFPAVFDASLAAYDRLREKVRDWSQIDSKLVFLTEPLENLFEISGYSKLFSELYQNPELWNVTERLWNIYFESVDTKQVIQFIAVISSYRDGLFMIMPQATLRSNWQIRFEQKMRERGLPMFPDHDSYDFVNRRRHPRHSSPLIRVIARWGGIRLMSSARNVFFATYMAKLSAAEGIELPDRRDLQGALSEEEQRTNDEIISDEDE